MAVLDDLVQAVQDNAGQAAQIEDPNANRLIVAVIGPAKRGWGLRPDITVDDIDMFIRMTVAADGEESRANAIDISLAGVICPVEHSTVDSVQT